MESVRAAHGTEASGGLDVASGLRSHAGEETTDRAPDELQYPYLPYFYRTLTQSSGERAHALGRSQRRWTGRGRRAAVRLRRAGTT